MMMTSAERAVQSERGDPVWLPSRRGYAPEGFEATSPHRVGVAVPAGARARATHRGARSNRRQSMVWRPAAHRNEEGSFGPLGSGALHQLSAHFRM